MRQTPEIPEKCQWAIFLRNHDELTLEMVTDSERDYSVAGLCRRTAGAAQSGDPSPPRAVVEKRPQRIELMNMLLLSMPGTPVIYYGDELGMGDNLHLGDRDGCARRCNGHPT